MSGWKMDNIMETELRKWFVRCTVGGIVVTAATGEAVRVYERKRMERKMADAPGNADQYDLRNMKKEKSFLKGKTILFLGSSVTEGVAAGGQSFVELLEYQCGVHSIKEAKSGTTLADDMSVRSFPISCNGDSYVNRLKRYTSEQKIDCFVCQLSTNDASLKKELGSVSKSRSMRDFNIRTVTGAMEFIIAYAKATWGCPVVFYTGSYYESSEYAAMVKRLYELKRKWDIGVIDLYTDRDFNDIDPDRYRLYMFDAIHPTKAGYALWWMPEIKRQLERVLSHE